MQRTGIEYLDFVYNSVKGRCPNDCWYCYMKRPPSCWSVNKNPKLRLNEKVLMESFPRTPGKRIGVGFNIELFHPKIPSEWINHIISRIRNDFFAQNHTFIFLTKNPARYAEFDFPKNCWLGVTVTKQNETDRLLELARLQRRNLIFVSYEPLLGIIFEIPNYLDWIIVGALTGSKAKQHQPQNAWVTEIVDDATIKGIPVFLKDNLASVWDGKLIQEFP